MEAAEFLSLEEFVGLSQGDLLAYLTRLTETVERILRGEVDEQRGRVYEAHFADVKEWLPLRAKYEEDVALRKWNWLWENVDLIKKVMDGIDEATLTDAERAVLAHGRVDVQATIEHKRTLKDLP